MNEETELWHHRNEAKKSRHLEWHTNNRTLLANAGISYIDKGETLLVRAPGKPKVDFYPSTGRWRIVGANSRTYRGGARAFLEWFTNQKVSA